MRKFKSSLDGFEVDLDDPKTYAHLPNDIRDLRTRMFVKIGFVFCYMNFWYKDIYGKNDGGQKKRIMKFLEKFLENEREKGYDTDILWYQEQIFLFEDETENMC